MVISFLIFSQFQDCNQLDYLNFFCNICNKNLCKDHTHIAINCPNYRDTQTLKNSIPHHNPEYIKCCFCSSNIPKFSSTKCDQCKNEFCLKHRLTFDHNCRKSIILKKVETKEKSKCSVCNEFSDHVKECNNCMKIFCKDHLGYFNHNCNKKLLMKETFLDNKNKILNDLKAKKLLKSSIKSNSTNESSNNELAFIKTNAKGNTNILESQRHYFRIVQNCQFKFDPINGFPIYRFYDKNSLMLEMIDEIKKEFQLNGMTIILNEKNDVFMKSIFPKDKKICEIEKFMNGDTIMLSKLNND